MKLKPIDTIAIAREIHRLRAEGDTRERFWLHVTQAERDALVDGRVPESVRLQASDVSDESFEERLQRNALRSNNNMNLRRRSRR